MEKIEVLRVDGTKELVLEDDMWALIKAINNLTEAICALRLK